MLDIDCFLQNKGVDFCRYVDDFRFFFVDEESALRFLAEFTELLFSNHRLTTNHAKTKLWHDEDFDGIEEDREQLEDESRSEHLKKIIRSKLLLGSDEGSYVSSTRDEHEATVRAIDELFDRVKNSEPLPTGLAKFVLRRAGDLKSNRFSSKLLKNLEHFLPVVGDVIHYAITIDSKDKRGTLSEIFNWVRRDSTIARVSYMQDWAAYFLSNSSSICENWSALENAFADLPQNIAGRYIPRAAARRRNWSLLRHLKEKIDSSDESTKRSIILASCALASDEKKHWLSRFGNSTDPIIRACTAYSRAHNKI